MAVVAGLVVTCDVRIGRVGSLRRCGLPASELRGGHPVCHFHRAYRGKLTFLTPTGTVVERRAEPCR